MSSTKPNDVNHAGVASAAVSFVVLTGGTAAGMFALESAGPAVCLAAPFVSGFAAAFVRNEWCGADATRLRDSVLSALIGVCVAAAAVMSCTPAEPLWALICLPPVAVLAVLGALMGHATARGRPSLSPVVALLMCWPLLAATELRDQRPGPREVRSMIEVDRSPEQLAPEVLAGTIEPTIWQSMAGITGSDPGREYRMHELSAGRTRIEARTVYTPELYPASYWSVWSDAIIHRMQMHALGQIKREAELSARADN